MNIYITQLKRSIREKLDTIEDPDYLASLDAVLTYETIAPNGKIPRPENRSALSFLKKIWPFQSR
jgi:hypothetical protein